MTEDTIRVLLIEDNAADARLIIEHLKQAAPGEFAVETASTLGEALSNDELSGIGLIVVDLQLPDSKGLDTFIKLQAAHPGAPVVVLSRLDDEEMAVRALRQGAQDYLIKGQHEAEELTRSLRFAVERHRAIRSELVSIAQLSPTPTTSYTAASYGSLNLRQQAPEVFDRLVADYRQLLVMVMEERTYKVDTDASRQLGSLADQLGFMGAGPRDVLDMHTEALKGLTPGKNSRLVRETLEEGRLLALELMGHLVSYYRVRCPSFGQKNNWPRQSKEDPPHEPR